MKTIAEALRDEIHYPLDSGYIENRLLSRDLDATLEVTKDILQSGAFLGAVADCLYSIYTDAPNISEADKSVTLPDRTNLIKRINSIYKSIGEPEKDDGEPKVYFGW